MGLLDVQGPNCKVAECLGWAQFNLEAEKKAFC